MEVTTLSSPREEVCSSPIPLFSTILTPKPTLCYKQKHAALLSPSISLNRWSVWDRSASSPATTAKLGANVALLTDLQKRIAVLFQASGNNRLMIRSFWFGVCVSCFCSVGSRGNTCGSDFIFICRVIQSNYYYCYLFNMKFKCF